MHVLYIHIYIRMCVDGCGWVDFSRVCGCVKGMHAKRVKESLSVCSAGGHLELSCGRSGLWVSYCKNTALFKSTYSGTPLYNTHMLYMYVNAIWRV